MVSEERGSQMEFSEADSARNLVGADRGGGGGGEGAINIRERSLADEYNWSSSPEEESFVDSESDSQSYESGRVSSDVSTGAAASGMYQVVSAQVTETGSSSTGSSRHSRRRQSEEHRSPSPKRCQLQIFLLHN